MSSKNSIRHISFIMDGNGRWARKRFLPRTAGHSAGVQKAKQIVLDIKSLGIPYLSLYTFSKENWRRNSEEVSFLMNLIIKHFEEEFDFYKKNKIKIIHIGDREGINKRVLNAIDTVIDETKEYTDLTLLLALNYSGRYDIVQAAQRISREGLTDITEDTFSKYLLTSEYPDPDLIIRTSGEFRVSNYFLWQAAYTEFFIVDKFWPDIKKEDIIKAIDNYKNRERRYGGVISQ